MPEKISVSEIALAIAASASAFVFMKIMTDEFISLS